MAYYWQKLYVYIFSGKALHVMCGYLKDLEQTVQINYSFGSEKMQINVPQGSINGSLYLTYLLMTLYYLTHILMIFHRS